MNIFQKKSPKPKRLSLSEMWELYNLLGEGMKKEHLLDEIIEMLRTIPAHQIKSSLQLMYGYVPNNPLEFSLRLVRGLQYNHFFEFQGFVEKISGSPK